MKVSRVNDGTYEYWVPYPFPEESRIIIESKNWKEADKKFKKLIRELRKNRIHIR